MRSRSFLIAFAALLPLLALGVGCSGSGKGTPDLIKIVSSMPRTGGAKGQTDSIANGIRMAIDEAGGKAGSFRIEYLDLDDAAAVDGKWTPERETANADQAARDPDVMVYIGPYNSGAAPISMPILNRAGVLMVTPGSTWPGLTKPGKGKPGEPESHRPTGKINFFRVVPADDIQGPVAAEWAKEMGCKKVYILHDNEVYGKGLAEFFRDRAKELKLEILGFEPIDYKQSDFRTKMNEIKGLNPDLIYFGGTSQTGGPQLVKDMINAGLDKAGGIDNKGVKLMVPDGCFEDAFVQAAGAEGFKTLQCYITFGGIPPAEMQGKAKEFVDHYKAKYGIMPEGYAIYGYEAARVALEAIRKANKKDRAAILDAARTIRDFEGPLGKWSFDENGDTDLKTMSGNRIGPDGSPKFVKLLGSK